MEAGVPTTGLRRSLNNSIETYVHGTGNGKGNPNSDTPILYICYLQLGCHPVAVVQYTFTHKQYTERHKTNNTYEGWNFNSGNYLFTTDTK